MEDERPDPVPGRGTKESADFFRGTLRELGLTQAGLARRMIELGDDRKMTTIERNLRRMAAGDARVSGEMRALLGLFTRVGVADREKE